MTALVAVAVGVIGYRQWRTAKDKLVLDLFERRSAVYGAVISSIDQVLSQGGDPKGAAFRTASRALADAHFLFQSEVPTKINELLFHLNGIHTSDRIVAEGGEDAETFRSAKDRAIATIEDMSHSGLIELFSPYMRMDHKGR